MNRNRGEHVLSVFLGTKTPETVEQYKSDLRAFTPRDMDANTALAELLASGQMAASIRVKRFADGLLQAGKSPHTVARRVSVLRGFVKTAQTLGLIDWKLDVPGI